MQRLKPRERGNQECDLHAGSEGFGTGYEFGAGFAASTGFGEGSEREGEHLEILTRPVVDPPATGGGGGGGDGAKKSRRL
jgi:hypothetical protein